MASPIDRPTSGRPKLAILFAVLTLLQLVPIWFVDFLPTGDGPSHLYGAWLVRALAAHKVDGAIASHYHIDWRPVPNWAATAFMAAAMSVVAPVTAEKLFFSLIIITFLVGAWMFARANDADNAPYAFLMMPLAYNQLLQAGFYNFSLSVGLYFITIALWWKRRDRPSWPATSLIAGLLLVCYFAHPMSAILAIASIGILWLWSLRGRTLRQHGLHLLALFPSAALLLWFLTRQPAIGAAVRPPAAQLLSYLTHAQVLYTFDERQIRLWSRLLRSLADSSADHP